MNEQRTILTIDDEEMIRQIVSTMLTSAGFRVLEASHGEEGLRIACEELPDIILLDVSMPVMDGHEVARRLKADPKTRQIPIIMLTGLATKTHKVAGLEAGADEYLTKPISGMELIARVKAMLRMADLQRELVRLERERHEAQLAFAREVQQSLLPRMPPQLPEIEIEVRYRPCEQLSGDFYDFVSPQSGCLYLVLSDAEGHGVSAALMMARAGAYLRAALGRELLEPGQLLARVNNLICEDHTPSVLLPMVCIHIDTGESRIRYANAGHQFPFLFQPSTEQGRYLESTGPMLGLSHGESYPEVEFPLHNGDLLFCYTDGLPDARNAGDEPFGPERVEAIAAQRAGEMARVVADDLMHAWEEHSGGQADDDTTLLVARFIQYGV